MYKADYFHLVPIRWTSWEALIRVRLWIKRFFSEDQSYKRFSLKGQYGSKSDVWSFGVTLWEILTFAREQPFEQLSDREVVENLQEMADTGNLILTKYTIILLPLR